MNLLCCVYVSTNNVLWTDFDNRLESRHTKLRLLGQDEELYKYTYDDLKWIVDRCDKVLVINSNNKTTEYNFVFEEVLRRITEIEKLVMLDDTAYGAVWTLDESVHWGYKPSVEQFNRAYKKYYDYPGVRSDWELLFYYSWYKMYDIKYRDDFYDILRHKENSIIERNQTLKENSIPNTRIVHIHWIRLQGRACYDEPSYIIDADSIEDYYKNKDKYKYIHIRTQGITVIWDIFRRTNYKASPIVYWNTHYYIMIDKEYDMNELLVYLYRTYNIKADTEVEFETILRDLNNIGTLLNQQT